MATKNEVQNVGVEDNDCQKEGRHYCRRCSATGSFITYVENGVPKGPGGMCFRCQGKSYHTNADRRRNWGHDMNYVPPGMS
jgi:hypothetical protein